VASAAGLPTGRTARVLTELPWSRLVTVPTVPAGWWCRSIRWVGVRSVPGTGNYAV